MFIIFGIMYILATQAIMLYPRLRRIELELPDTVGPMPDTPLAE